MARNNRSTRLQTLCAIALLAFTPLAARTAHAQNNSSPQIGDACQLTQTVQTCANLAKSSAGRSASGLFLSLAVSNASARAGIAHGQTSQSAADMLALANCRAIGITDCKVQQSGQNICVGYAVSLTVTAAYTKTDLGYGQKADRASAAAEAVTNCQNTGGKNCAVRATPCAGDNPAFPAALPLPSGGQAGSVDPNWVGAWELDINGPNGGRWVMQVGSNGTYEMHSEALDQVGSNAGTFSAKAGHYTLHATNISWDDSGTYTFQAPGTMVAAGKLGTGTWHKIAQDDE